MGAFEYPLATAVVTLSVATVSFHLRDFSYLFAAGKMRLVHYWGLLAFCLSLLFQVLVLIYLQTVNDSEAMCTTSILTCILVYASTKLATYMFLIERVYLVTGMKHTRRQDRRFLMNVILIAPYGIVLVLMLISFNGFHGESRTYGDAYDCYIGINKISSVPLVTYDTCFAFFLTVQFLAPLKETQKMEARRSSIKDTARRNMIGSTVATTVSFLNILSLAIFPAERAFYCLTFCVLDTLTASMVVYYMCLGTLIRKLAKNKGRSGAMTFNTAEEDFKSSLHQEGSCSPTTKKIVMVHPAAARS